MLPSPWQVRRARAQPPPPQRAQASPGSLPAGESKPQLKLQFSLPEASSSRSGQWIAVPPDCNVVAKDGGSGGVDIYRARAGAIRTADGPLLASLRP